ncbi:sugar-binding domain-containing protein [Ignavibacteria bacterium 4148-Me]|uniref:glycoside hydrolase family 2 protein n=1 Tax=Rosettibacter primus TaxID=3111523 RepID=UPI00336BE217
MKTKLNLLYFTLILFLMSSISNSQSISLSGRWYIIKDNSNSITLENIDNTKDWQEIIVPCSWHRLNNDFLDYQGVVWYKKNIKIILKKYKRYIIRFDAVDYYSKLFINRKYVGENEGGYLPFDFDITEFLKDGENEILLRVTDPSIDSLGTDGISYYHIPHGKQNWYVQNSGIWQEVYLLIKPLSFVKNVMIDSELSGNFTAKIFLNHFSKFHKPVDLIFQIYSPDNKKVYEKKLLVKNENELIVKGNIISPLLWELNNPNLYSIKIKFGVDYYEDYFGFREFKIVDKKFYLNDKPFYMIAALDQDFYPETIYEIPDDEYLKDEMIKAKQMGLNTLRCHIKIPDKRYLKAADKLGLLIWYEIPNWDLFDENVKIRVRNTFDRMLERDWNHPSLVIISLINESWGIDLSKSPHREWLVNEFNYAKDKAKGRLIVDNSACWGNFHLKTDINDYHTYWSMPERYKEFSNTIKEVSTRPKWLFSSYGDSYETGNEALIISEFGNWGLPIYPKEKPFWFSRKFNDIDVVMPEGVIKRFNEFGYSKIFYSYNNLAKETQWAQFRALKYEIEEIRLNNEIQGYVITEFTDLNWECNGLLDMWRNFKIYHKELSKIQNADLIIPRTEKFNYWEDETIIIDIFLSHYSNLNLSNSKIIWVTSDNQRGEIIISNIIPTSVKKVGLIKITCKEFSEPQKYLIKFYLINNKEEIISTNYHEIFIYPRRNINVSTKLYIELPSSKEKEVIFKNNLSSQGYLFSDTNSIIITNTINDSIYKKLKNGRKVICLIDSSTNFYNLPFVKIKRDESWLDGSWVSSFSWVKSDEIFKKINFTPIQGFEAVNVFPNYIISSIKSENFNDVLSGLFIGWIHFSSPVTVKIQVGKGNLILTSYKLLDNYSIDPYATYLLDNMIHYINSENFLSKIKL